MAKFLTPQRLANSSVWPGKSWPARCNAFFCSGAVVIASTFPPSANLAAVTMAS